MGDLRRAPRAVVVREVALQVIAAGLSVAVAVGELTGASALLGVVTAVILLVRLRWPALATVAVSGLLLSFFAPGLWLAAALSAFSAGRSQTGRRRLWLVLTAAGLLCVATTASTAGPPDLFLRIGLGVVGAVLLLVVPALCGALVGQRRPAAQLLAERNAYLERAQALTVEQARWEERGRIAADMHDVLGHRLSLLAIHAGALEVRLDARAPELSEQAHLVRTSATAALEELRATLSATSETTGDLPAGSGKAPGSEAGVRALADHWRTAGTEVEVAWEEAGEEPLDPRVGRAVDHAVRECLTNAHKHAPDTAVTLTVQRTPRQVAVSIANTAPTPGASAGPGNGLGLLALAERSRLVGGCAAWGATRDGGFELVAQMPAHPPPGPDPRSATAPPPASALLPPPPVRAADVLSWRRVAVVVASEAGDGHAAVSACRAGGVDVALLDVRMPGGDGLSAAEAISRTCPGTRVVMLTTFDDEKALTIALRSGAVGFLLKGAAPRELLHAVRAAARGEQVLAPQVTRRPIERHLDVPDDRAEAISRLAALTPVEREVLAAVAEGLSNADVAARLYLGVGTVKTHLSRVLTKLGCENRVQAAVVAHEAGIAGR